MKTAVIIVAAGSGRRMRLKQNKILLEIADKPVIIRTLEAFFNSDLIEQIILVIRRQDEALIEQFIEPALKQKLKIVYGGAERSDSVAAGCRVLNDAISHVLVHDGARPFISDQLIKRVVKRLTVADAVIPVMPVSDTVKVVSDDYVERTLQRETLRAVQTPQGFARRLFEKMVNFSAQSTAQFTDDASVAEALGQTVYCVAGEAFNIKVTTKQDLVWATLIARQGDKR